jgi:hypothetical protein
MDFMATGIATFQTNGFKVTDDMTIARNPAGELWTAYLVV